MPPVPVVSSPTSTTRRSSGASSSTRKRSKSPAPPPKPAATISAGGNGAAAAASTVFIVDPNAVATSHRHKDPLQSCSSHVLRGIVLRILVVLVLFAQLPRWLSPGEVVIEEDMPDSVLPPLLPLELDERNKQDNDVDNVKTRLTRLEAMKEESELSEDKQQKEISELRDLVRKLQQELALKTGQMKALLEDTKRDVLDQMKQQMATRVIVEQQQQPVRTDLVVSIVENIVRQDGGVGKADFALVAGGASVVRTETSPTYWASKPYSALDYMLSKAPNPPEEALSPSITLGSCWPCQVGDCRLSIKLSARIRVTHVTIEHLSPALSVRPIAEGDTAPKDFTVYASGGVLISLGKFTYKRDAAASLLQTFAVAKSSATVTQNVVLEVNTNYGNPESICLYRFRVHGEFA